MVVAAVAIASKMVVLVVVVHSGKFHAQQQQKGAVWHCRVGPELCVVGSNCVQQRDIKSVAVPRATISAKVKPRCAIEKRIKVLVLYAMRHNPQLRPSACFVHVEKGGKTRCVAKDFAQSVAVNEPLHNQWLDHNKEVPDFWGKML